MAAKLDFTADSLLNALDNEEMLAKYGLTPQQALALFPEDSYEVYWTASPESLIDKIGDNYLRIWNDERKEKAKISGFLPPR